MRIDRRKLLKLSGAGAVAAGTGMAGILAAGRAPAYAQGATLHWLRWNDFVPASDQLLRKEITAECQKALGIRLNIETINGNDIQARITSAIQSGAGPDVFCALSNWPQLYPESVSTVDIPDQHSYAAWWYAGSSDPTLTNPSTPGVGQLWSPLLPANAAYRFHAERPGVILLQTIVGDDTVERWAEICLS